MLSKDASDADSSHSGVHRESAAHAFRLCGSGGKRNAGAGQLDHVAIMVPAALLAMKNPMMMTTMATPGIIHAQVR